MSKSNGYAAEISMKKLVKEMFEYINPNDVFSEYDLLEQARNDIPTFKSDLIKAEEDGGITLTTITPSLVFDLFFGLDYLFEVESHSGRKLIIGVDVTTNPYEVKEKVDKIKDRRATLQKLKINYSFVVLWDCDLPYNQLTKVQKLKLAGALLDAIDNSIEKRIWVDVVNLII